MKHRTYKNPMLQKVYDHMMEKGKDSAILPSGKPRGDGWSVAFWRGWNGLTLNGRIPHQRNTHGWVCYMAGRDARKLNDKLITE